MPRFRPAALLGALRRPAYLKDAVPLRLQEPDTGDLVLFSGRSLAARLVQGITGSYWSHVGIVVRLPPHRPSIDFVPRDFGPEAVLRLRRGRLSPVCLLAG